MGWVSGLTLTGTVRVFVEIALGVLLITTPVEASVTVTMV